jgi:hypothetical protein
MKTRTLTLTSGEIAVETTLGKFAVLARDGSVDLYDAGGRWLGWIYPDGTVNGEVDSELVPDLACAQRLLTSPVVKEEEKKEEESP